MCDKHMIHATHSRFYVYDGPRPDPRRRDRAGRYRRLRQDSAAHAHRRPLPPTCAVIRGVILDTSRRTTGAGTPHMMRASIVYHIRGAGENRRHPPPQHLHLPLMPSRATPCLTRPSQRRAYNGRGARQTRDPVWAPRHPHPGPRPAAAPGCVVILVVVASSVSGEAQYAPLVRGARVRTAYQRLPVERGARSDRAGGGASTNRALTALVVTDCTVGEDGIPPRGDVDCGEVRRCRRAANRQRRGRRRCRCRRAT